MLVLALHAPPTHHTHALTRRSGRLWGCHEQLLPLPLPHCHCHTAMPGHNSASCVNDTEGGSEGDTAEGGSVPAVSHASTKRQRSTSPASSTPSKCTPSLVHPHSRTHSAPSELPVSTQHSVSIQHSASIQPWGALSIALSIALSLALSLGRGDDVGRERGGYRCPPRSRSAEVHRHAEFVHVQTTVLVNVRQLPDLSQVVHPATSALQRIHVSAVYGV
jgi:hypothetical protein